MVTGKYIKSRSLFILVLYILGYNANSVGEAWIPDEDSYHFSSTFSTIDKRSKNKKNRRASSFIKIRDEVDALYSIKSAIHSKASNEKKKT